MDSKKQVREVNSSTSKKFSSAVAVIPLFGSLLRMLASHDHPCSGPWGWGYRGGNFFSQQNSREKVQCK